MAIALLTLTMESLKVARCDCVEGRRLGSNCIFGPVCAIKGGKDSQYARKSLVSQQVDHGSYTILVLCIGGYKGSGHS